VHLAQHIDVITGHARRCYPSWSAADTYKARTFQALALRGEAFRRPLDVVTTGHE
jgi:hypothetical protein